MWSPARFKMAVTETPPSQGPGGGSSGRKAVRGIVYYKSSMPLYVLYQSALNSNMQMSLIKNCAI